MPTTLTITLLGLYTLAHLVIVLIIILGSYAALLGLLRRAPALEKVYFVTIGATIASYVLTGSCFLTEWDQALRARYWPETAYSRGFISQYMTRFGFDLNDWHVFYFLVITISLGILGSLYYHLRRTHQLS